MLFKIMMYVCLLFKCDLNQIRDGIISYVILYAFANVKFIEEEMGGYMTTCYFEENYL